MTVINPANPQMVTLGILQGRSMLCPTGMAINVLRTEMAIVLLALLHATSWPGYVYVCPYFMQYR